MSLGCGEEIGKKNMQTRKAHANPTQKAPHQVVQSNSGLSCCEATVLITQIPMILILLHFTLSSIK